MKNAPYLTAGCLVFVFVVCALHSVNADPLYDNGPPNEQNGSEMTHWIEAEDFTLNAPAILTDIRFWDFEFTDAFQGSITWQIYSTDSAGRPETVLFSGTGMNLTHTATGLSHGNTLEFVVNFDIGAVVLPAGDYWLGLHNGPLTFTQAVGFYWETTDPNGTFSGESDVAPFGDQNPFVPTNLEHAFIINVPEGKTVALLLEALGLFGLFATRRVRLR
jgi:hypothetical protein